MRTKFLALLLVLPMLAFCDTPIDPEVENGENTEQQQPEQQEPEQQEPEQQEPETPAPEDNLAPEIKNGDIVLAPNPYVEKFVSEVTYPDHDYSYSKVLEYDGGYNGNFNSAAKDSDKPSEYTIRWEKDDPAGKLRLELSELETGWSMTQDILQGETHVAISNLTPNVHYTYKVSAVEGGKVMTEGEFATYGSIRQVFFKTRIRNGRDMGGWKTYDGKMVKYHKIYRTGRPEGFTNSSKKLFIAEGIKAQLDLRNYSDVCKQAVISDLDFCAPIIKTGGDSMLTQRDTLFNEAGEAVYDENGNVMWGEYKMYHCMQFIIDCIKADKPVFYHCSLGRDRTGTLGMIILGLLDVIEGDISKEYEVTYFSPVGWSIANDGHENLANPLIFKNLRTTWAYKPAAEHIWKNYVDGGENFSKGIEDYLITIGITKEDIDTFRQLMLTEPYPAITPAN